MKRPRAKTSKGGHGTSYKASTTDFRLLAAKYPALRNFVYTNKFGSASIDWKDPHAQREVTYALLKNDFDLDLELPIDQLCPPVPNRANYIYWLKDMIQENSPHLLKGASPLRGIDIGTGASCIYPLLGAKIGGWSFLATDIDETSIGYARRNVTLNNLESSIELRKVNPDQMLLGVVQSGEKYGFSMCNPPFFANINEARQNPHTVCMGTSNELVTPGGEVSFVERMIEESLVLRHAVRWYTSMIGKKDDLKALTKILAARGIVNVHTTTFYQGKITRWGLAWSLTQDGLESRVKAKTLGRLKGKDEMCFSVVTTNPSDLLNYINDLFRSLEITLSPSEDAFRINGEATVNTWRDRPLPNESQQGYSSSSDSLPEEKPQVETPNEEEAQNLNQMQTYLTQYDQVKAALVNDPENSDLLEVKESLDELISLAHQLYNQHEPEVVVPPGIKAMETEAKKPAQLEARGPEVEQPPALTGVVQPRARFQFCVRAMQSQGSMYMIEFSWNGGEAGTKMSFYELFDFFKRSLHTKFLTP